MPRSPGQIDTAKTEAILDAAAEVIAERGLAAPMEEIARRAGVSKQTVYNRYGGKPGLLRALVARRVTSITAPLRGPDAAEHPEEALAAYAGTLLSVITRKTYSLMRVTIQSAGEMPELAREVFETGPMASRAELARFLEMETKAGRMAVPDPVMAAEFFSGMVSGHRQTRALMNLADELTQDRIDAIAKAAAAAFMRAYAP